MARNPDGVILMGPPGSGKSYIGNALASAGVACYVELEPILVAKFGKGAEFWSNKEAALGFIRASYAKQLAQAAGPVALESTGVSDRPLIEQLRRDYELLLVRVETPKDTCLERIANRPTHLNIGNDVAASARFFDFWYKEIEPTYDFAAAVDGTNVEVAVSDIANLLEGECEPS